MEYMTISHGHGTDVFFGSRDEIERDVRESFDDDECAIIFDGAEPKMDGPYAEWCGAVPAPTALLEAARATLEWEDQQGGWDAQCWADLRAAVAEIDPPTEPRSGST